MSRKTRYHVGMTVVWLWLLGFDVRDSLSV